MKPKTLNECFAELIKPRNRADLSPTWYSNTGFDRKTAYRDKVMFEKGELAESKIRFYLSCAGYKLYQPEMWVNEE